MYCEHQGLWGPISAKVIPTKETGPLTLWTPKTLRSLKGGLVYLVYLKWPQSVLWCSQSVGLFLIQPSFSPLSYANGEIQSCWFSPTMDCELFQRVHYGIHLCNQHTKARGQSCSVVKSGIWSIALRWPTGHCTHWLAKVPRYLNSASNNVHTDIFKILDSELCIYIFVCFCFNRYDHLSVLCELMPLGLLSLASCLQTLQHGLCTSFSFLWEPTEQIMFKRQ